MRISELSRLSGVSTASIKYYVRAGLLHEGVREGYNHTEYAATHLERLRLIRVLLDEGGLTVVKARAVLAAIDTPDATLLEVMEVAQRALPTSHQPASAWALATIEEACSEHDWIVEEGNAGLAIVAQVLDALNELGRLDLLSLLPAYADAADAVARADVQAIAPVRDRAATASMVVIGTVLGDRALQGLRRIAQGNYVRRAAEQP